METINFKRISALVIGFVAFTIIGTLSHELGHIAVAYFFGFETQLFYAHMEWNDEGSSAFHQFWIAAGGPIQTMTVGTIGLLFLIKRRKLHKTERFKNWDWFLLFLSFFWLREIFNLIQGLGYYALSKDDFPFGGDEAYLSKMAGLSSGFIPLTTALVATVICCYVTFFILPKIERINLIISTFIGGLLGFFIWMHWLGPILLP